MLAATTRADHLDLYSQITPAPPVRFSSLHLLDFSIKPSTALRESWRTRVKSIPDKQSVLTFLFTETWIICFTPAFAASFR